VNEGFESVKKQDNRKEENANPSHIRLKPSSEVKVLSVDALNCQGTVESDEAGANTDPRN
jgi:hypothetical protein